jgi:hypothetical protein
MTSNSTHNQSVAGEVVAMYNKSTGKVQINLNIGKDRPIDNIPSALNLSLDGHACNIVVKTSPATAANRQKHAAHSSIKKRKRNK